MSYRILLTGATDGIGLVTADKLVAQGHHVFIHGRSADKLTAVAAQLNALSNHEIESYRADLSNLAEVDALAEAIIQKHSQLDIIINNAGIYKTHTPITQDQLDVRFMVNTIAPYRLTQLLLPIMQNSGRVINLSSAAQAPVDLAALEGKYAIDDQFSAYAQSKLAITMWSRHLAHTLGDQGPAIIAVNPGSLLASKMVKEGFGVAGNDINIGADILIRLATSDEFATASGRYFDNDMGQLTDAHPDSLDTQKCQALVNALDALIAQLAS